MNIDEYYLVKNMSYLKYCDYLQKKYGIGLSDYFTENYSKNPKCSRTDEGLVIHHKDENKAVNLSQKACAQKNPFEWQTKEHLVYCDYLEHLFLHILICREYFKYSTFEELGVGGIVNYLVPELNDVYSGWIPEIQWQQNCFDRIKNDKDVYLLVLNEFIDWYKSEDNNFSYNLNVLHTSFNERYGYWSKDNNASLFAEIDELWGDVSVPKMIKEDWHNYLDLDQQSKTKEITMIAISREYNNGLISGFPFVSGKHKYKSIKEIYESDDVISSFISAMPIKVMKNKDVIERLEYFLNLDTFLRCYPRKYLSPKLIKEAIDLRGSHCNSFNFPEDIITFDWWKYLCYKHMYYNGLVRRTHGFPEHIWQKIKADGKEKPEHIWERIKSKTDGRL